MKKALAKFKEFWQMFRSSGRLHNTLVFLIFLGIAFVFWFVMAMNDNVQRNINVHIEVVGVPDSVKFISDPPSDIHVMVRDKGTSLMRVASFRTPTLTLNFKDFSRGDAMVLSSKDLQAGLKATFGGSAMILSTSLDSIRAQYVTGRGRRIPVRCDINASAAAGSVVSGRLTAKPSAVIAYGPRTVLDTLASVNTVATVRRDLMEPTDVTVKLRRIPGVRLEPSEVKVHIPVEPLVSKDVVVPVSVNGVPAGIQLLIFPSTARVNVFVPMSKFSREDIPVEAWVDYSDVSLPTDKLPVRVRTNSDKVFNATLVSDSVEYTLVK